MAEHPYLAQDGKVALRRVDSADLPQIARFPFTVSITEPLTDLVLLGSTLRATDLWQDDSGALAIVEQRQGAGSVR